MMPTPRASPRTSEKKQPAPTTAPDPRGDASLSPFHNVFHSGPMFVGRWLVPAHLCKADKSIIPLRMTPRCTRCCALFARLGPAAAQILEPGGQFDGGVGQRGRAVFGEHACE